MPIRVNVGPTLIDPSPIGRLKGLGRHIFWDFLMVRIRKRIYDFQGCAFFLPNVPFNKIFQMTGNKTKGK